MLEFAALRARSEVCIDANEHELANKALEQLCASGLTMNCVLLTTLMKGFIRVKRLDLAMNLYEQMRSSVLRFAAFQVEFGFRGTFSLAASAFFYQRLPLHPDHR